MGDHTIVESTTIDGEIVSSITRIANDEEVAFIKRHLMHRSETTEKA